MANESVIKYVLEGDAKGAVHAVGQVGAETDKLARHITTAAKALAGLATGYGLAKVSEQVISTSATFERFTTQLTTIEGTSKKAQESMAWITDFTAKTPYELDQVTDSFVKLKAYGIDPIANDTLRTLGDTAAAMGKPLSQAVEALADAATGEFERLKEFGIKASVQGDKVAFNYSQNGKQMVATADKNSQEMLRSTLLGIWNEKYAGGMDKLSQTWEGMTSNLSDKWTLFQKSVGDAGAFNAAKGSLAIILDELDKNKGATDALAKSFSDGFVGALKVGVVASSEVAKAVAALGTIDDVVRLGVDELSGSVVDGFLEMLKAASGFAMFVEGITGKDLGSSAVEDLISNVEELKKGISASEAESASALEASILDANKSIQTIDSLANKLTTTMENAKNAAADIAKPVDQASQAPGASAFGTEASAAGPTDAELAKQKKLLEQSQAFYDAKHEQRLADEQRQIDAEALRWTREVEAFDKRKALLEEEGIWNAETKAAHNAALEDAEKNHQEAMKKIKLAGIKTDLSNAKVGFDAVAGLMNTKSREMFEVGKAASIASASISAISTAMNVYQSASAIPVVGWILGPIAAAAALATGVANVQKIASTSFGQNSASSANFGGANASAASAPSPRISGGVPESPKDQKQSQEGRQIVINNTINTHALDPSAYTPEVNQKIVNGLAAPMKEALQIGHGDTVTI